MFRMIAFLFIILAFVFGGNIYYTDSNNSSSGNGSAANPFRTVAQGMQVLTAGDTLFIRGDANEPGRRYEEHLSLSSSSAGGSAAKPIVVLNYPNEKVHIVLTSSFFIYTDWWTFDGLTFDMEGKAYDIIKPKGDHLTFRRCQVINGQRDGFDINMANFLLIENCRIHNFKRSDRYDAHGIILNGGQNNTIRNSIIYDCKGDCIQLYKDDPNYNTVIEGNDLYTTLGSGSENAIDIKATQGCIIRNNKMHGFHKAEDSDGVALKINKNSDDVTIEGNDIYESNGGFRISGGETEHIIFSRNCVHDLHADEGNTSKYGYGIQFDGVDNIEISNNTFARIPGPLFWIASRGATDITMQNNLFYDANSFKGSTDDFSGTVFTDYNGWFQCQETISGSNDVSGADPRFVDEKNQDYHLNNDSPAIDKGNPASGTDFPGGRVDLGAFEYHPATSLKDPGNTIIKQLDLQQNYPNPFNPATQIRYRIQKSGPVRLTVYNALGQKVKVLVDQCQPAGSYAAFFTAPGWLPSGIYFYTLQNSRHHQSKRMLLVK